jgi:hypothetical protein
VGNLEVLAVVAVASFIIVAWVRRNYVTVVAKRGLSIGADLGTLGDKPRVRVQAVTESGPDRAHLVLAALDGSDALALDMVVELRADEFGFGQLEQWQHSGDPLGIVMPPDSHIVRLRSISDLQPLTLRRVDDA